MGYRSDVAYCICFRNDTRGRDMFHLFVSEARVKDETKKAMEDEALKVNEAKLLIMFQENAVKWYDSFEDVMSHESLIDMAEEYVNDDWDRVTSSNLKREAKGEQKVFDELIGYSFVRIGEEIDDIDSRSGGFEDAHERVHPEVGYHFNDE